MMGVMTRREFLGGFAAVFASLSAKRLWGEALANEPLLRFGVMSDTHLETTDDPATLGRVLRYLRERNVDAVVISGDITERGLNDEVDFLMRIWEDAFPGGVAADGRRVEKFFVWGNHDYADASYMRKLPRDEYAALVAKSIMGDKEAAWRRIGEGAYPGETFAKKIKGFSFVGTHWKHENETGAWLKAHPEVDTSKLFFYVQHPHPAGTVFVQTERKKFSGVREDLKAYPNCFSISGHSHLSVSDDMALWQGEFTAMGTGSTKSVSFRKGRETSPGFDANVYIPHTRQMEGGKPSQASIVSVYENRLIVERHEFRFGGSLGDAWELPLPLETHPENPFVVASAAPAPEFPAGAAVSVVRAEGKDRGGREEMQYKVKVPYAEKTGRHGRAIEYRFDALNASSGEVLLSRTALQDRYGLCEEQASQRGGRCTFAVSEFPEGAEIVFRVTPLNAYGRGGRAISGKAS